MSERTHRLSERSAPRAIDEPARYAARREHSEIVRRLNDQPEDALSGLLRSIRVHTTVFCVSELRAPWGFRVENSNAAKFHLVLEGGCELELETGEQLALKCGDLVWLPSGTGHVVRDQPGSTVRHLDQFWWTIRPTTTANWSTAAMAP